MISDLILHGNNTNLAISSLTRIIRYIALSIDHLTHLDASTDVSVEVPDQPAANPTEAAGAQALNEDLIALVNRIIDSARSGTVSLIGALLLIFIGIQLPPRLRTPLMRSEGGVKRTELDRVGGCDLLDLDQPWRYSRFHLDDATLGFNPHPDFRFPAFQGSLPASYILHRPSHLIPPRDGASLPVLQVHSQYAREVAPYSSGRFLRHPPIYSAQLHFFIYVNRVTAQQSLYGSLGIFGDGPKIVEIGEVLHLPSARLNR